MAEMHSRHWAILGLTALGVTAMVTGQDTSIVSGTVAGITGIFVWDKIEKYTNAGKGK